MNRHNISNGQIKASINAHGAELCSLKDSSGKEFLWQAGDAWKRHAPNLFPIVGRLKNDTLRHKGQTYKMTQHGFARDSVFEWVEHSPSSCRLSLRDSESTRAVYPFAFRFDVVYALEGNTLSITYEITNTGDEVLPAAMGAHPAFIYPLDDAIAKHAHYLEFSDIETAPTRRLSGGLLMAKDFPNPVQGRKLPLDAALFAQDAVIMDKPNSRSVRYTAPNAPIVDMAWDDNFPQIGIWSKDGADLLCIEPWHGMSSPEDFDGDITEKPNMMLIKPNERRSGTYTISLLKN